MSLKSTKMQGVSTGDVVLLVWFSTHNSEDVSTLAEELKSKVGPTGHVLLENVERIALGSIIDINPKYTTINNLQIIQIAVF
jgi:hypothetical protein